MDPVSRAAEAILDRDPSPAVPMEQLRTLLEDDPHTGGRVPEDHGFLRVLRSSPTGVRILLRPRRRWACQMGPQAWVLAGRRERGGHPRSSVRGRMRFTLRALGRAVEPGSAQAWARWNRMMEEETRVRSAIESRERRLRRRRGVHGHAP